MEVAAHQYLSRTHTAPVVPSAVHSRVNNPNGPSPLMPSSHQSHGSLHYSTYSHPSTRSSDSTQGTSTSTLFPPQMPPTPSPSVLSSRSTLAGNAQSVLSSTSSLSLSATNSVLNTRANKETSLFQFCLNLRRRLRAVPGFEEHLLDEEQDADDDTDPVTLLWRTFRRGQPLLTIYNTLNPPTRLEVDPKIPDRKRSQTATYKFLQACLSELRFPSEDCFIITDLYGDDTTGFTRVARVVNRVLDILVATGHITELVPDEDLADPSSSAKRTQKEHIIDELVKTERTYVQHLELLQAFKKLVEEKGIITGDAVHDIFLNLNALLDFQRRFLIRVEQTNSQSPQEQNWGKLFVLYRNGFKVYEPYIANQKRCEDVAIREFDRLKFTGGPPEMQQMVESPTVLSSFLLKPFQRLAKYPLLLKELRDKGDLDEDRKKDISDGIEAASSVLQRTNEAVDMAERVDAVEELKGRVEDWKGHRIEVFGSLLLHGNYTVLKGDTSKVKDSEREYKIYLFESILLCCKEIDLNKNKNKITSRSLVDRSGKPKLQLKGRIFMQNVTECISMAKPGNYTCQIFWKGDPGIENFIVRFNAEETMNKWAKQLDDQRRIWKDHANRISNGTTPSNVSQTEFTYMRNVGLENPYAEQDDEFDDDDGDAMTVVSAQTAPADYASRRDRNDSNTSLRSRSTTGDSLGATSMPRVPPPRFPINYSAQPPLTLRTQQLQNSGGTSPGHREMDSYFSPTVDSPMSSRTSGGSSTTFPFPRQQTPRSYAADENQRFTAPAMGRSASREAQGLAQQYQANGGTMAHRPLLPANAQAASAQSRLRSASSPDIQNPISPQRRMNGVYSGAPPDEPVPPFPTHYAYNPNPTRSQSNSPQMNMPVRQPTHRERMIQQTGLPGQPRHIASSRSIGSEMDSGRSMEYSSASPPPMPSNAHRSQELPMPTQLKVKVHVPSQGSTLTLVVPMNVSYQTLKDRIDAKLQRTSNVSLSAGQVKLKYIDDDDYVSITSDEDVQTAFETWREQKMEQLMTGQLGEIELYCTA